MLLHLMNEVAAAVAAIKLSTVCFLMDDYLSACLSHSFNIFFN